MKLDQTVPYDDVKLKGFVKIDYSPTSDVYISLSEFALVCKPDSILSLKLGFSIGYAMYCACFTSRRSNTPRHFTFPLGETILEMLNRLIRGELPDGATLYLFGYQEEAVTLPKHCPKPEKVEGQHPKLIAVVVKNATTQGEQP